MGVQGLAPFLKRACPEVIRTLPSRLQSLRGKTVVIDGTLITQRLHFAPMPHRNRHVLGWYRIVRELQECDVNAICVFDGKQRSLAKQMEMDRRREERRMTAARGVLERERLRRLHRLTHLLGNWRKIDQDARERATRLLRALAARTDIPLHLPSYIAGDLIDGMAALELARDRRIVSSGEPYDSLEEDAEEVAIKRVGIPVSSSQDENLEPLAAPSLEIEPDRDDTAVFQPPAEDLPPDAGIPDASLQDDLDIDSTDDAQTIEQDLTAYQDEAPSEHVLQMLSSLYIQYRQSVPKLMSISEKLAQVSDLAAGPFEEVPPEYAMSKTQNQLIVDEGKFWDTLIADDQRTDDSGMTAVAFTPNLTASLSSLLEKSTLVSASYERRTHPPTEDTYDESKEMLHALGVPCVEPDGPFEAEALACSLVISGYADYVASEDTDVLVYGVPLMRNLTTRHLPIIVISGADVRGGLELDHAGFVDFALLLGTDFSPRIKNVGPARALRFIRTHGSIERLLEREPKYPPRVSVETYLSLVEQARMVFETLPPPPAVEALRPREPDDEEVTNLLMKYGLQRIANDRDWDPGATLSGNYFQDDPNAS